MKEEKTQAHPARGLSDPGRGSFALSVLGSVVMMLLV